MPYPSQMTAAEGVRQALEDIDYRCSAGIPRPLLVRQGLCNQLCSALSAELQRDLDSRQEEAWSRAQQDWHDTCGLRIAMQVQCSRVPDVQ